MGGIAFYRFDEIGDQVKAALILGLHISPCFVDGLFGRDEAVVLRAAYAAATAKDGNHENYQYDCLFFHSLFYWIMRVF